MDPLTICTWSWGTKYSGAYIDRLCESVRRNVVQPFNFRLFTPADEDLALTQVPGCFARLRMFDPAWQEANGVRGRLVCLDLDLVVTGPLDPLFDRNEDFVILQGANASNPCPYNGSVMMLRTGAHAEVWGDFSLEAAAKVPKHDFADDQGWLAAKIPDAAGWKVGEASGIYAFQKPGWPRGEALPKHARIVAFPGWRDPVGFTHLPWIRQHWRT